MKVAILLILFGRGEGVIKLECQEFNEDGGGGGIRCRMLGCGSAVACVCVTAFFFFFLISEPNFNQLRREKILPRFYN